MTPIVIGFLEALPLMLFPCAAVYNQHKTKKVLSVTWMTLLSIVSCVVAIALFTVNP